MRFRAIRNSVRGITALAVTLAMLLPGVFHGYLDAFEQPPLQRALPSAKRTIEVGRKYLENEARAVRVTAQFGSVSTVAERGLDGSFRAVVRDQTSRQIGELKVNRTATPLAGSTQSSEGSVEFDLPNGHVVASQRSALVPTLDWAALQAYLIWKDAASSGQDLEWQDWFLRSRGPKVGEAEDLATRLTTDYDNGVKVDTRRRFRTRATAKKHPNDPYYASEVTLGTEKIVAVSWFPSDQRLTWQIKGSRAYFLVPEMLPEKAWTFDPTMSWANVQAFEFYKQYNSSLSIGPSPAVSRARPTDSRAGGVMGRVLNVLYPVLEANEPGCDGFGGLLHHLDGTTLRRCCDDHDSCYYAENPDCSSSSWYAWLWGGASWQCVACNLQAVLCFAVGGDGEEECWDEFFQQYYACPPPGGGGGGDPIGCTVACDPDYCIPDNGACGFQGDECCSFYCVEGWCKT